MKVMTEHYIRRGSQSFKRIMLSSKFRSLCSDAP